ncbi:MAG: hypothetical protein R3D85_03430 [Paracoccaceae bacterium]
MQGFSVVYFAVQSMARDPGATIRLTVLPWAVGTAVAFALFRLMAGLDLQAALPGNLVAVAGHYGYLPAMAVSLFVFCMIGAWVAMSWHRHILLKEEAVAVLPKNNSEAFDGYFDAVMKFALLAFVIFLMIKFLLVPLVPVLGLAGLAARSCRSRSTRCWCRSCCATGWCCPGPPSAGPSTWAKAGARPPDTAARSMSWRWSSPWWPNWRGFCPAPTWRPSPCALPPGGPG